MQAQAENYKAEDIEDYEYVACSLTDCCKVCKALDGKTFKVKDMEPGENAPPMHPNCHCATAPYMDREEFDEWLDGYSEHGLTFEEWNQLKSKTNEVSRNLAIRNGNIYGIITEGNTNVPKELQKEIDNSLHRIFREFPKMRSFINKIEFSNELERNEIAQAVINKKLNTILRLNTKIFSNKKVYKNLIDTTEEIFVKKIR